MEETNTQCSIVHRMDAIKLRNYGRILQDLVAYATTIEDEPVRVCRNRKPKAATIYIARCMRQKNQIWNKDFESGVERLREDIAILSQGKLSTDFPEFAEELCHTDAPAELKRPKVTKRTYKK